MRQIGVLDSESLAIVFVDYLMVRGFDVRADEEDGKWVIWSRHEDEQELVREHFELYVADPNAREYREIAVEATRIRQQIKQQREEADRRTVLMGGRWQTSAHRRAPLTMIMIAVSVFVWLAAGGPDKIVPLYGHLTFCKIDFAQPESPVPLDSATGMVDGFYSIRHGEIWRLVSPIFIHYGIFHLAFNMYWLYAFGSIIESRRGTLRFALMVLAIAVISNVGEYLGGSIEDHWRLPISEYFGYGGHVGGGGMSGVGYGLFGYLWMKTLYEPESGMLLNPGTAILFVVWFFICLTGAIGPIGNWAHGIGFLVGVLVGRSNWFIGKVRNVLRPG